MNLFESINNSLNNTVKSLSEEYLTEKKQKQEISPEDEKDNEVIRKVLQKMNAFGHYLPSDSEAKILRKHDIDYDTDSIFFRNAYYDSSNKSLNHEKAIHDNIKDRKDYNKINFVDMARKEDERAKNYYDHYYDFGYGFRISDPRVKRGEKKSKGEKSLYNSENLQDIERYIENTRLRAKNQKIKTALGEREGYKKLSYTMYDKADEKRNELLAQIQELKNKLKNLDAETEQKASEYMQMSDAENERVKGFLDNKRKELQALKDRKRQKNESLLLEKKYTPTPEDERDDALLRSVIMKLHNGEEDEITDEERDAAERNGYEIDDYDNKLRPKYGWVTKFDVYNPVHGTVDDTTRVVDKVVRMRDKEGNTIRDEEGNPKRKIIPANVNLADLGRKRQERINKFPDYTNSFDTRRNRKKKYNTYGGDISYDSINFENRVRKLQNQSLSNEYNFAKNNSDLKRREYRDIERAYRRGDERREEILNRIAAYKKELMDLDNNTNITVNDHISNAKYYETKLKDMIDAKKKNIEEIRNRREERKNVNK